MQKCPEQKLSSRNNANKNCTKELPIWKPITKTKISTECGSGDYVMAVANKTPYFIAWLWEVCKVLDGNLWCLPVRYDEFPCKLSQLIKPL